MGMGINEVIDLHKEKFGVDPIITGLEAIGGDSITIRIMKAIHAGKPYNEGKVEKGVLA